ncbi:hypothetical protein BDN71DRAFT_1590936 [Pleurotus eryngii]|uniref:Uncharacterized protein n=1 Tax=Pleurotus eryngii TaxID=5323 RepID=A0A9P5ZT02_PLEER|nr:hypothetical protein BDN71DRAFT_1590936 [Pleurotus eryngii]
MARRKANGKRDAALKREANKRTERELLARESALLLEIDGEAENRDADYQPPLELEEDDESSEESDDGERAHSSTQQLKRKLSDALTATGTRTVSVIEDQANVEVGSVKKRSRTSVWRDQKGKTRRAHAMNMQPSVASFFKTLPGTINMDAMSPKEEREESSGGETKVHYNFQA